MTISSALGAGFVFGLQEIATNVVNLINASCAGCREINLRINQTASLAVRRAFWKTTATKNETCQSSIEILEMKLYFSISKATHERNTIHNTQLAPITHAQNTRTLTHTHTHTHTGSYSHSYTLIYTCITVTL